MSSTYVLGFMFDRVGAGVALLRKTKPEWQAGRLNGVGGKVEKSEVPRAGRLAPLRHHAGRRR